MVVLYVACGLWCEINSVWQLNKRLRENIMKTSAVVSIGIAALYWIYIFYKPSPQQSESNEADAPLGWPLKLFFISVFSLFTGAALNGVIAKFSTNPLVGFVYFSGLIALLLFVAVKTELARDFSASAITIISLGAIVIVGLGSLLSTCSSNEPTSTIPDEDASYYRK